MNLNALELCIVKIRIQISVTKYTHLLPATAFSDPCYFLRRLLSRHKHESKVDSRNSPNSDFQSQSGTPDLSLALEFLARVLSYAI